MLISAYFDRQDEAIGFGIGLKYVNDSGISDISEPIEEEKNAWIVTFRDSDACEGIDAEVIWPLYFGNGRFL